MRAAGLLVRVLVLVLAARLSVVPPTRQVSRSDSVATGRVLHRYCVCARRIRWPQSAVPAGGNGPGVVVASSSAQRGRPLARMASAAWSPALLPTADFLIRPPSRLLC
jgi:hypothetical protein